MVSAYRYTLLSFIFSLLVVSDAKSQDIHFSQFYMSPLNLTPAMTGVMNGSSRLTLNYRNQWAKTLGAAAYNTASVSYDQRNAIGQDDFFGFGGALWNDVAGDSRFGSTQIMGAGSYSKKLAGGRKQGHYITAGVNVGLTQRRVRTGDLRWLTQVDLSTAEYCAGCGTPEQIDNNNFMFADISGGLMWFSQLGDRTNFFVGGAMHHINKPNVSFLNSQRPLNTRITAHAGGEVPINKLMSLRPNVIYMTQGPHKELNVGTSVRLKTKMGGGFNANKYFIEGGLWYRTGTSADSGFHSDALILVGRFDFEQYSIGLSYDYTISGLSKNAIGNGSFELAMTYMLNSDMNRGPQCPTF